jgi:hypothetical protein
LNDPDGKRLLRIEELQPPTMVGLSDGFEKCRKRFIVNTTFSADAFRNL